MDQKQLQEKIALYYSKLPPNLQTVFSSMAWVETLKAIGQKYGLNEKQLETLNIETTLVLLGITHVVEYEETLTNELGLPSNSLDKVLMEIEESILKSIRPQLALAFEANKRSETEQMPDMERKLEGNFEKLPEGIEDIIKKSNYQTILYDIAKKYNFTVTQMDILEKIVTSLIIGATHPDEFEDSLENSLKMPPETTKKLVTDINEKIFLRIREMLKTMNTPKGEKPSLEEIEEEKEKNINQNVMNSVGIEIIPEKLELETEKQIEDREEALKNIEKPEKSHPIFAQKLSASVQTPITKTEHSLENITKTNTPTPADTIPKKPKFDPYREIPE